MREVDCSMNEISDKEVTCNNCGKKMKRIWVSSFIIPEHMKNENTQEMSYVKDVLKKKPSGRGKIYY